VVRRRQRKEAAATGGVQRFNGMEWRMESRKGWMEKLLDFSSF